MDKIKIFKEKALPIEVDIMQDYYPGDPQYIGRESDEKTAESLKKHAAENNIELPDIDGIVFHYYPIYTPESQMELYYNDALFSAPDMSLDYLRSELKELEAYSYKELFDALDVLSSRFSNEEIMCRDAKLDVKRFKNIFYKQFKKRLHITGRVTSYFIGCLRKEIRLKEKYLEMLINKVRDTIDIKLENAEKMAELTRLTNIDSKTLNDTTVKIDFNLIFYNAADYLDDPDEMREYIKREYKNAEDKFYYQKESFCKGILKIAAAERDNTRLGMYDESIVTDTFIYIAGGGIRYTFEEIDLIEEIVNELQFEDTKQEINSLATNNNSTKATSSIKALFDLIDFLHSNINEFKKHDSVIEEIEQLNTEISNLESIDNYKKRMKKIDLDGKRDAKLQIIYTNITNPIKSKALELEVCDWSYDRNIWNWSIAEVEKLKHQPNILTPEEVENIVGYKNKYVEYRKATNNDYGTNSFFTDLDSTLYNLFSFFCENIEKEFVQFNETAQRLKPEKEVIQTTEVIQPKHLGKTRGNPGRKKANPKDASEYLKFHHDKSKKAFLNELRKLDYIYKNREFVHLILAIDKINRLEDAQDKELRESFQKALNGTTLSKQNYSRIKNDKNNSLLEKIAKELNHIIDKNNLQ